MANKWFYSLQKEANKKLNDLYSGNDALCLWQDVSSKMVIECFVGRNNNDELKFYFVIYRKTYNPPYFVITHEI